MARLGVKRAISPGYAAEWCAQHGDIGYFEIDTNRPHGIMEALNYICDEYLLLHPPQGAPVMRELRPVPRAFASERDKAELPWTTSAAGAGPGDSGGAAADRRIGAPKKGGANAAYVAPTVGARRRGAVTQPLVGDR